MDLFLHKLLEGSQLVLGGSLTSYFWIESNKEVKHSVKKNIWGWSVGFTFTLPTCSLDLTCFILFHCSSPLVSLDTPAHQWVGMNREGDQPFRQFFSNIFGFSGDEKEGTLWDGGPSIINPIYIYTLYREYLLGISSLKGSNREVKQLGALHPKGPPPF